MKFWHFGGDGGGDGGGTRDGLSHCFPAVISETRLQQKIFDLKSFFDTITFSDSFRKLFCMNFSE